jgi:hypothetical protein
MDIAIQPFAQAAVFNVGCGPFVAFILSVIGAGVIAWVAQWIVGYIPMNGQLKAIALKAIYVVAIGYVILLAAQLLFGISILNVQPIVC